MILAIKMLFNFYEFHKSNLEREIGERIDPMLFFLGVHDRLRWFLIFVLWYILMNLVGFENGCSLVNDPILCSIYPNQTIHISLYRSIVVVVWLRGKQDSFLICN